jgi:hypothetical protein
MKCARAAVPAENEVVERAARLLEETTGLYTGLYGVQTHLGVNISPWSAIRVGTKIFFATMQTKFILVFSLFSFLLRPLGELRHFFFSSTYL